MRLVIALAFVLLAAGLSSAGSPSTLLGTDGRLDSARVSAFVAEVEPFLREWPPRFRDAQHQKALVSSMREITAELRRYDLGTVTAANTLVDVAQILAMGHNLDLDTGPAAKAAFERALALEPESRRINYLFGMFLISTQAFHFQSQPYLEKAFALGEDDAAFSLGLLHVRAGRKTEGLVMLEAYSRRHPDNDHVRKVVQSIKEGTLEFRESGG